MVEGIGEERQREIGVATLLLIRGRELEADTDSFGTLEGGSPGFKGDWEGGVFVELLCLDVVSSLFYVHLVKEDQREGQWIKLTGETTAINRWSSRVWLNPTKCLKSQ